MSQDKYAGLKAEFHILQSFPVTCLNRDDVGAPKTAVVGGVTRARVSSQCWKRQVRLSLQEFGVKLAVRTKHIKEKIADFCVAEGSTRVQADTAGEEIAKILSTDTLHFFTDSEARALAVYAVEKDYKINEKEVIKVHKKAFNPSVDGLDIALFGRMVAQAADLNIEAAASFSHAISTHKATNEVEFFTALDDYSDGDEIHTGSSHMGSLEFNSATYYRYISLDLGQLVKTLGSDEDLPRAIEAFVKAVYVAVPSARQTTQAGYSPWDYAKVYVRRGQRLQASFDQPVRSKGEGYVAPSIVALEDYLTKIEKVSGSLFGKVQEFIWGKDDTFSIDDLISGLGAAVNQA